MLSAIIIAKNEEQVIGRCLDSLSFANEVIVIDDESTDNTQKVAKKYNARVISRPLKNFADQRNFGFDQVKNEWVLFVDADEVVPESLQEEISAAITLNNYDGFLLKREDIIWGKTLTHGDAGNTYLLRLGKRSAGSWYGKVHEVWNIKGRIGTLQNPLMHYPHQTIAEFLSEINFYSDLRAKELYDSEVKVAFLSILAYPKAKFILNYFIKFGFLDGIHGFVHAIMMSFYSFLVRGKLWLLWERK